MDIDTPPVLTPNPHTHLAVPSFHSSFCLPYRVLFLIGLGLFLWTTNLHLLHHLGIDVGYILAINSPSSSSSEALTTGRPVLPEVDDDDDDEEMTILGGNPGDFFESNVGGGYSSRERGAAGYARAGEIIRPLWGLLAVLVGWSLGGWILFIWLSGGTDQDKMNSYRILPLLTGLGVLAGTITPYGRIWRRERMAFVQTIKRTIFSPLSEPVHFVDVICADILTSFAKVFGDLWVSMCLIFAGNLSASQLEGAGGALGPYLIPFITSIPYMIRFRQCMVEYISSDYKQTRPLANALKYSTAFPVILFSAVQKTVMEDIAAERGVTDMNELGENRWFGEHPLFRLWLLSVFVNSLYSFWWDVTNDWGLTILSPSEWSVNTRRPSLSKPLTSPSIIPFPSTMSSTTGYPGNNPTGYAARSDIHKRTTSVSHHHRHHSSTYPYHPGHPSRSVNYSPFSGGGSGGNNNGANNFGVDSDDHPFGLRKEMHFADPTIYYLAIIVDLVLRFTWSLKLSSHLHSISEIESGVFLMEALELARRWMWVFLRIEWEDIKRTRARLQRRAGTNLGQLAIPSKTNSSVNSPDPSSSSTNASTTTTNNNSNNNSLVGNGNGHPSRFGAFSTVPSTPTFTTSTSPTSPTIPLPGSGVVGKGKAGLGMGINYPVDSEDEYDYEHGYGAEYGYGHEGPGSRSDGNGKGSTPVLGSAEHARSGVPLDAPSIPTTGVDGDKKRDFLAGGAL
ncbi:Predicted small molecule transporter [Phaffia rhodozyma]|uniref:Predicted small molecule transporter n=1 Tax=Phaffia rhodozyma TaxID=264483 RepID=A0A0F7SKN4_PHARH|nr:Predicted small molecule transporter [Phaffia rhodozyma]